MPTRRVLLSRYCSSFVAAASLSTALSLPAQAAEQQRLTFQALDSGVKFADIALFDDNRPNTLAVVGPNSKVTFHVVGRLLGKQGWVFMNTRQSGEDPYRLTLGTQSVIPGLEQGLQGMRIGGKRRIVIPSKLGYQSRNMEPIPRDFGNQQRLYTTVLNNVRKSREREALGQDLAGVVVLDVELLRIR